MSGGKGGGTTTTTQSIPKWVEDEYKYVVGKAKDIEANTSFTPYTGEFVAPLSTTQTAGIQNVNNAQGMALPAYAYGMGLTAQGGQGVTPQFTQAGLNPYMSPYLNSVVGSTMANINEQNASQRNALAGSAISKGAYGGDRYGVQQAELARQQGLSTGQTIGNLLQSGYGQALGQYNQNIAQQQADQQRRLAAGAQFGQLGEGAQSSALQGAQAQLMAGAQEQATQQALDQAKYNQFLQQQAYPFQKTSWLANIAEGIGSQSGGTSTTTQPGQNQLGSILGGALTAASMFKWSDERMKEDAEVVGKTFDGQPIYKYRMKDGSAPELGLMAHDVEKVHPEAVRDVNGYKQVNYDAATHDAAERGHFASGGLVPMGFAVGGTPQFGMMPYVGLANGLGYIPQANIPVGKSTIPKPPTPQTQDSNAAQFAKGLQAMPQAAKNQLTSNVKGLFGPTEQGNADLKKALAQKELGTMPDQISPELSPAELESSKNWLANKGSSSRDIPLSQSGVALPASTALPPAPDGAGGGGFGDWLSGLFKADGGLVGGYASGGVVPRMHFQQGGDAPVSETPAADELRAMMAQKEDTVVVPVKTETGVVPVEIPKSEATGVVEPKNRTLGGYKKASEVATGNDVYAQLHPEFAPKFRQFIEEANRRGIPITPGSMYRSPQVQAGLVADKAANRRGAYQGLPVANPYESGHNYGVAADFAGYKPEYRNELHDVAKSIPGMVYGGEFGDPLHVQLGRNFGQLKPHAYDEKGNFNRNFQLPEAFLAGLQNSMPTQVASAPAAGVGSVAPASGGVVANDPDMPSRNARPAGFVVPPADWTKKGLGDRLMDTEGESRSLLERVMGSSLSDEARSGLMAAGLGMMASRGRHFGKQIGEGGLGGLQTYYNALANKQAQEKTQADIEEKKAETGLKTQQTETAKAGLYEKQFIPGVGYVIYDKSNPYAPPKVVQSDPGATVPFKAGPPPATSAPAPSAEPAAPNAPAAPAAPMVAPVTKDGKPTTEAVAPPAPSAPIAGESVKLAQPTTKVPEGFLPKNQMVIYQNPDSLKEEKTSATKLLEDQREKARNSYNQKFRLDEMDSQIGNLPKTGLMSQGPLAGPTADIAKNINATIQTMGGKGPFDTSSIAAIEQLQKDRFRLGAELSRSIGGREPGFIVQQSVQANPGVENTPMGYKRIVAGLREAATYEQDRESFYNDYSGKFGHLNGAEELFRQLNPPELYSNRAILSTVDPRDATALKEYAAKNKDPSAAANEIDKVYGKGVSKMILGH